MTINNTVCLIYNNIYNIIYNNILHIIILIYISYAARKSLIQPFFKKLVTRKQSRSPRHFYREGCSVLHYVKSVRIDSYSGPYFPAFGLNTERYAVSLRIQSECGKIQTRIIPNTDTFYALLYTNCEQGFVTTVKLENRLLLLVLRKPVFQKISM